MAMLRNIMVFINFLYTVLVLNYSAVGFMVITNSFLSRHIDRITLNAFF